jgi:CRISPR-associated protein Cas2
MVVIILERVPPSLRGELSRWLIEPKPGVFIGHVSALVREKLWEKCCRAKRAGGVIQAWSTNNEQRFAIRTYGLTKRRVMELDGVQLMMTPHQLPDQPSPAAEVSAEPEP